MSIFNLLYKVALGALQAMSIATGLVYTILMCIACQVQKPRNFLTSRMIDFSQALWLALQVECGDLDPRGPAFDIHVLDPFFSRPYCHFAKCGFIHSFSSFCNMSLKLLILTITNFLPLSALPF